MQRRRFKQAAPLNERLTDEAQRLRKEARGTPAGIERERLMRKARQAEYSGVAFIARPAAAEVADGGLSRVLRRI